MSDNRRAARVFQAMNASDGAGVRLKRSLGSPHLPELDPFLLLDHFGTDNPDDYVAGFPNHPHRGFETVTYMLDGRMRHKDSTGNQGDLGPGSIQWMTAGRGIIHSEMPLQEQGRMSGFQLWVNLPASHKMVAPRYQDIPAAAVPVVEHDSGVVVKVLAGTVDGVTGPIEGVYVAPIMVDVTLPDGASWSLAVPEGHTVFGYVFEGEAQVGGSTAHHDDFVHLVHGDRVELVGGSGGGRVLLLAGAPIGEPIARYGPFVMNTQGEIRQALLDFQAGRLA